MRLQGGKHAPLELLKETIRDVMAAAQNRPIGIVDREGVRATVQSLGWRSGGRYQSRRDDISTVACWFQSEPFTDFPPLPVPDALDIL